MAAPQANPQQPSEGGTPPAEATGLRLKLAQCIDWATATRWRKIASGAVSLTLLVLVFATWSYVGHVAVLDEDPWGRASLATALAAVDRQDFEEARAIISHLQKRSGNTSDHGGYLFVLGAAKDHQADSEWSEERRRAAHLVAARYLQKAQELGVPDDREDQLKYLLGKCLIDANQAQAGISILLESIQQTPQASMLVQQLLTKAYLNLPSPNLSAALEHNQLLLADAALTGSERSSALLNQASILMRLGRFTEAQKVLDTVPEEGDQLPQKRTIAGQLTLESARQAPPKSPQRQDAIDLALTQLQEAQRLDALNGEVTRQAMVLVGECFELQQDTEAAIQQYELIGNRYGDSPESIVATLRKAELIQASADAEKSLIAYRTVLESVDSTVTYANPLLPLSQLRKALLHAHARYLDRGEYAVALALTEHLVGLFRPTTVTELRGMTHVAWANALSYEAADSQRQRSRKLLAQESRYHYRAAGREFDALAQMRSSTRFYLDDLWAAAENYFHGQSYTLAAEILEKYLHHEARNRRALALLRYGQAKLAVGRINEVINALEECIEMHPRDASVFAARVACAQAYLIAEQPQKAEALLQTNLIGDTLTPESPEWRDSLFLLGNYLHDAGVKLETEANSLEVAEERVSSLEKLQAASEKHLDCVEKLREAITRYPDAPQALLARYTIAKSYQGAAEAPARLVQEAKTENERQKNRKTRDDLLNSALGGYAEVLRIISQGGTQGQDELVQTLRRNCYIMQGDVLFRLHRYDEARSAYANVSTLYQHEPFVLESFVRIANCWHRLNQPVNARQTVAQARLLLDRIPADLDFKKSTNFSRQQWELLLDEMAKW